MKEKELNICIWIHHAATFLGIICSVCLLIRRKLSKGRICILTLFLESQLWGAFKIISDFKKGRSRLRDSYEKIHTLSKNGRQERRTAAGLCCGSVLFKLSVPWLIGREA